MRGVLIDLGGVLIDNDWRAAARSWGDRLGVSGAAFLAALFEGSDDQVLIGRVNEDAWFARVRDRLRLDDEVLDELRADLAAREHWNAALVALLRELRGTVRIAVVSNAWPQTRARIEAAGFADIADELVISAEVGCAKPDAQIFRVAVDRLALGAGDALFIDDTPGHVEAAVALGMRGCLHRDSSSTAAAIRGFLDEPHAARAAAGDRVQPLADTGWEA